VIRATGAVELKSFTEDIAVTNSSVSVDECGNETVIAVVSRDNGLRRS
jgi:hypothetical protein